MSELMLRLAGWPRSPSVSVLLLVAVNAIPLIGVLWFGWDAFTILILYWVESGVVGVVNVFKIARAEGGTAGPSPTQATWGDTAWTVKTNLSSIGGAARGALILFFCLHYGIFWFVHGVFVLLMPVFFSFGSMLSGEPAAGLRLDVQGIAIGTVALIASHVASYWINYVGRGEYRNVTPVGQTMAPYGRTVVMHVVVVLGGSLIFTAGQPIALLALLVVGKTILDVVLHVRSHRRAQRPLAFG